MIKIIPGEIKNCFFLYNWQIFDWRVSNDIRKAMKLYQTAKYKSFYKNVYFTC